MSNIVSSMIFCARNVDKAENQGKVGRWGVAAGQGKKVFDYIVKLDGELGEGARATQKIWADAAKSQKALGYANKALNFASEHVNPLIVASAGLDVLNSENKQEALITNTTALTSMFTAEKIMKQHLDDIPKMKCLKKVASAVAKFSKHHKNLHLPAVLHGVVYVVGSCLAYDAGTKFGDLLINKEAKEEQA